ncbi:MAG: hypothetical protein JNN15_02100 [Blastocatellia bacterium]|nr:hypothetical protein [Blastocatellia bacterium]
MAINPLQGGYVHNPTLEQHQEATREDKPQEIKSQEKPADSPLNNTAVAAQVVQQSGEPIPIQHTHEAAEANITDRDARGEQQQEDEGDEELAATEKKTQKNMQDLEEGLREVAEGIEQLKDLQKSEDGIPPDLEQRLRHISKTGGQLVSDIEEAVRETINSTLAISEEFFQVCVKQLTTIKTNMEDCISDLSKGHMKIPTPEVRDNSTRAQVLRKRKQEFTLLLDGISNLTNSLLEDGETGIKQLLAGREFVETGFAGVNRGEADGFKLIELGFRVIFSSISTINDSTIPFKLQMEQVFKNLSLLPDKLAAELGSKAALGLPEKLAAPLWKASEVSEHYWRSTQGNINAFNATLTKFGKSMEATFEDASKAIMGEGQIAVDCVNEDLGDLKEDVSKTLSSSAANAVDQILKGAEQVEEALDELIATSEKKHKRIKKGSTAKLPSHFNVRL